MKLNVLEEIDDSACRGRLAIALLWVKRQRRDPLTLHRLPKLAFYQRLNQKRQVVDRQQCHHTVHRLEKNRSNLELRLELREALLYLGLLIPPSWP